MTNYVTLKDIAIWTRRSYSTVKSWQAKPDFPEPFYVGKPKIWDAKEIDRWIRSQR